MSDAAESSARVAEVDRVIRERRSVRGFHRDRPVEEAVLREVLEVAQRAPSNCNVQPWRVFIASGAKCDAVRAKLVEAASTGMPNPDDPIDTFEGAYRKLQVECAVALYGKMGIARDDGAGRMRAMLRNFELFDAPHVAIICMEKDYGLGVALDVGMYVQSLMLAMWARGIGSCAQAALRLYPDVLREELSIPENLRILCGVSFGYEDASVAANGCRQERRAIEENVVMTSE